MGIGTLKRHHVKPATPQQSESTPRLVSPSPSIPAIQPKGVEAVAPVDEVAKQSTVEAAPEKEAVPPAHSAGKKAAK